MQNPCTFSPDRRYRYTLLHTWDEMFATPGEKPAMFIGLNPSTADENQLDPTLRRIRGFCAREGYRSFLMTNIFAFRATDPQVMRAQEDPNGPGNDAALLESASRAGLIVAAWGVHGAFLDRGATVTRLLQNAGHRLVCLGVTAAGAPKHPLYVKADTPLVAYGE